MSPKGINAIAAKVSTFPRRNAAALPLTRIGGALVYAGTRLNLNLLDFVEAELVIGAVVKLGRAGRFVGGNLLSFLDGAAVFQVVRDSGGPEAVAGNAITQACCPRPPLNHCKCVTRRQSVGRQFSVGVDAAE